MIPNEHLTICIDNLPNAFDEQGMVNAEAIHQALENIQGIPVNELKITGLLVILSGKIFGNADKYLLLQHLLLI